MADKQTSYPTPDQFWRAYQNKERPADVAEREKQK
jgi:hypothetical protein